MLVTRQEVSGCNSLGEWEVSDGTVAISSPMTFRGDVCREVKSKSRCSELPSERVFEGNSRSFRSKKDWMLQGIPV